MWWIVAIIIILCIIGSSSGGNKGRKEARDNSNIIREKHQALLEKYGARDVSQSVVSRNTDIVYSYLRKLKPGYHSTYSDFATIKNCYVDIYTIEGYGYLLEDFNSWKSEYNIERFEAKDTTPFKGLYKAICGIFEKRFNALNAHFGVKSKYLNKTYDFSLDEKNTEEFTEKIIGDIKQRDSKNLLIINSFLDKINIQKGKYMLNGTGLYFDTMADIIQTYIVDNKFIKNTSSLDKVVETVFGRLSVGTGINTEDSGESNENIEYIIDDILKGDTPNLLFKIDNSNKDSEKLIDKVFMNNEEDLLYFKFAKGALYFEDEEKKLSNLEYKINNKSKELTEERSKMIKEIKDKINQLITLKNNETNEIVRSYNEGAISGIEGWVENLLKNLYFDTIQNVKFDLLYDIEGKNLILEYYFPSLEKLPTYKDESKTGKILRHSDAAMKKLYDKYISSLCIRLLYEIYNNDSKNYIDGIVFNGIVTSIDKSNGHERTDCILSVSSEKKDIKNIVLENIDPKETIKSLHGICATSLSSLTPVAPISTINKNDKRFVEGYNVIDSLNDSVNIACMDWQDFENLIRDLFEKIYGEKGGEVKITQASRDGGVDAIAFDPDPVTGGKILIQAKRYTNVVGVGAVRDLAGAVHHEGAMKGILVTTSNFGHDAMKFVAKEPISLINGQNLLSLLNKYGYHAHIDIKEARKILKEQEKK